MSVNLWTNELLEKLKNSGDPLADETVAIVFRDHDVEEANRFLVEMIKEEEINLDMFATLLPGVRAALERYFELSGKSPEWADQARIKNAERLFREHGEIAFSLLGCASLPELYTCGKGGTQVLGLTLQLEDHVPRRIYETAQMVIGVMAPGGLDYNRGIHGTGIKRIQKVRLMHAAVRYLILLDVAEEERQQAPRHFGDVLLHYKWGEGWGMPIGQEYMGATLQTFSYVIIRGMRQFGIDVSEQEANDFIHAWNVVGHHMGVDEVFLRNITTMQEAELLYDAVMARNRSQSDFEKREGVALTNALMDYLGGMIRHQAPLGKLLPAKLIPRLLTEELVGRKTTELLGVRLNAWQRLLLIPFRLQMWLMGLASQMTSRGYLVNWKFRVMVKELNNMPRGQHRPPFQIPEELAGAWKLESAG